ncbi:CPBP family intramembrane glutamic endopeptidase [Actinoallomurus sp. NPDC052274]|uniref:CPBP family intramembrane glutamic endopeptidase n=1 Tax=Actinoallomurus sp. NPDC052274 TaxID=3155420 RepID=UPI00341C5B69
MLTTQKKGVVAFLLMTFGVTWAYLFTARFALGLSVLNPVVQLPMGFAPAVAAVITRRWITREGFADAGLRLGRSWFAYLAAWLGPPVFVVAALAVAAVAGVWHPGLSPMNEVVSGLPGWSAPLLLMVVVVVLTPLYWGEEFGWTSYLRPRLFPDRPMASVVTTGLIWAVWHYPLAFIGYIQFGHVALGLAVWTVAFVFQEVLLAWLWTRSGSVWPPSLAHAGNNMVLSLLTGQFLGHSGLGDTAITLIMYVPVIALGAWILLTGRLTPRRPARHSESRGVPARR